MPSLSPILAWPQGPLPTLKSTEITLCDGFETLMRGVAEADEPRISLRVDGLAVGPAGSSFAGSDIGLNDAAPDVDVASAGGAGSDSAPETRDALGASPVTSTANKKNFIESPHVGRVRHFGADATSVRLGRDRNISHPEEHLTLSRISDEMDPPIDFRMVAAEPAQAHGSNGADHHPRGTKFPVWSTGMEPSNAVAPMRYDGRRLKDRDFEPADGYLKRVVLVDDHGGPDVSAVGGERISALPYIPAISFPQVRVPAQCAGAECVPQPESGAALPTSVNDHAGATSEPSHSSPEDAHDFLSLIDVDPEVAQKPKSTGVIPFWSDPKPLMASGAVAPASVGSLPTYGNGSTIDPIGEEKAPYYSENSRMKAEPLVRRIIADTSELVERTDDAVVIPPAPPRLSAWSADPLEHGRVPAARPEPDWGVRVGLSDREKALASAPVSSLLDECVGAVGALSHLEVEVTASKVKPSFPAAAGRHANTMQSEDVQKSSESGAFEAQNHKADYSLLPHVSVKAPALHDAEGGAGFAVAGHSIAPKDASAGFPQIESDTAEEKPSLIDRVSVQRSEEVSRPQGIPDRKASVVELYPITGQTAPLRRNTPGWSAALAAAIPTSMGARSVQLAEALENYSPAQHRQEPTAELNSGISPIIKPVQGRANGRSEPEMVSDVARTLSAVVRLFSDNAEGMQRIISASQGDRRSGDQSLNLRHSAALDRPGLVLDKVSADSAAATPKVPREASVATADRNDPELREAGGLESTRQSQVEGPDLKDGPRDSPRFSPHAAGLNAAEHMVPRQAAGQPGRTHAPHTVDIQMRDGAAHVRLDDGTLGPIEVRIERSDAGLSVLVRAERSDSADLIRRNADLLQRELTDSGVGHARLDFGQGGRSDSDRPAAWRKAGDNSGGAQGEAKPVAPGSRPISSAVAGVQLDMRL